MACKYYQLRHSPSFSRSLAVALSLGAQGWVGWDLGGGEGGGRQTHLSAAGPGRERWGMRGERPQVSVFPAAFLRGSVFSLPPLVFFARPFLVPAYLKNHKVTHTHTHRHTHARTHRDPPPLHRSHSAIFVWTGLRSSRKALSDVLK